MKAALPAATLLLAACSGRPWHPAAKLPPGAGDREGALALEPCGRGLECGALTVRESRAAPSSRLIRLPVHRLRALRPSGEPPVFILGGGPGMTNQKFAPWKALRERHDVVMVGYRGVDGSVRLDCPEVRTALGRAEDILDDAASGALSQAFDSCFARLRRGGVDLGAYNIAEMAEDLEDARVALGYGRVHLLSMSFGTRVAQLFAARHSDATARVVLVGANPPGRFVWEPGKIDEQLAAWDRLCSEDPECAERTKDLAGTIRQVLADPPKRWALLRIRPGKAAAAAFLMLFHRGTGQRAVNAFLDAAEGSPRGLSLLCAAWNVLGPRAFVWGDFYLKAYTADFDAGRDYRASLSREGHVLGSPLSRYFFADPPRTAPPVLPRARAVPGPFAAETLILSGELDFSTPAEYARDELLPILPRARQVVLRGRGHVDDLIGAEAAEGRALVDRFLAGEPGGAVAASP